MQSNHLFEHGIEGPGVFEDVARRVSGCDQFHWGIEVEAMFRCRAVPYQETGNDGCSRTQGERGDCRCCCGGNSEEIGEYAFVAGRVLVDKNADRFVVTQRAENIA